jgi:hypothetical protein
MPIIDGKKPLPEAQFGLQKARADELFNAVVNALTSSKSDEDFFPKVKLIPTKTQSERDYVWFTAGTGRSQMLSANQALDMVSRAMVSRAINEIRNGQGGKKIGG